MPIVPIVIATSKGVQATLVCVSDKRYNELNMEIPIITPYMIPGSFFRDYLRRSGATGFEFSEAPNVFIPDVGTIVMWKDAIAYDFYDVVQVLEKLGLEPTIFIKDYATELESLLKK